MDNDTVTLVITRKEATAVKFVMNGARQTINSEPHFVAPLHDAIAKLEAAMAPPAPPADEPETSPAA